MVFTLWADGGRAPGAAAGLRGSRRGPCTGGRLQAARSCGQCSAGGTPWVLLGSGPEGPAFSQTPWGGRTGPQVGETSRRGKPERDTQPDVSTRRPAEPCPRRPPRKGAPRRRAVSERRNRRSGSDRTADGVCEPGPRPQASACSLLGAPSPWSLGSCP